MGQGNGEFERGVRRMEIARKINGRHLKTIN